MPNKRLMLLLLCIIILVAMIGFSLKDGRKTTWPEKLIGDTTGVFQNIFHTPAEFFAGIFEDIDDLKNTYEENERLRKKLDGQTQYEAKLQALKDENKSLRDELGHVKSIKDYDPILATVIARNPDKWYTQITINKGTQQKVAKDMAVTNEKGALVGKIKSSGLNNFTSAVQLLSDTDRNNRVATKISGKKGSKGYGLIEGYDTKKKTLTMKILDPDEKREVKKGDLVETSGTGGVFPEGLTVGEVTEVEPDAYGLTKIAHVKPAADIYDLNNVIVVKRDVPAVDSEEEGS
ncbi:rod shape-determining protein MreC [Bacillus atrophaeus]|uniref:Cell shape-determining protein MreC n=1 Tax=Bacillus atrophaeus (strain 1942) TaxID=720555 RepID=A0ABM5LZH0_BACA1|nr:rod shape-determining protein MreC [Bacillus atrophaeus]AMR61956.1 rod shape-determining protein MreC [Bacillus subtilis subsp. globigii]ADP33286.1 rod shape-determining protein MreC [Bacillus atrophaeus 1942]AIK48784.1 rod shape-determining protein MreC [Bacillus atrophaeus subsp. globigii]ARW07733.1 Cell shape-determining protein MreC [Bacillus atrophaeus]ASS72093.1 rod shape-determining protein MreC [Bacillus atrophaeus]